MNRFLIIIIIVSLLFGIPAYMWGYSVGYKWGKELEREVKYNE